MFCDKLSRKKLKPAKTAQVSVRESFCTETIRFSKERENSVNICSYLFLQTVDGYTLRMSSGLYFEVTGRSGKFAGNPAKGNQIIFSLQRFTRVTGVFALAVYIQMLTVPNGNS